MDILDVNEYLNAAEELLQDDSEYRHWFEELVKCRKEAEECGFNISRLEGVMYQLYVRDIGCILDKLHALDEADLVASETTERMTHDDVFASARKRIADIVNKGIDDYETDKTVPGKETLQKLRNKYSETPITDSLTGIISDECTGTKVTFRQTTEKTITIEGANMADIYRQIEELKDNPDEIDFDKDCDSVVIEARLNI